MDPIMIYEQASDMIAREIQKLVDKGNIDKETLCLIGEAIDVQKDLETLKVMKNEGGYSRDDYSYDGQSNRRGRPNRSYDGDSWDNYSNRGRSYDNMSGHGVTEQLIYKLEDAMNMAEDRQSREVIRMALEKLEKM